MIDLELDVFDNIKAREVIGETPSLTEFSKNLENSFNQMNNELEINNRPKLEELLQKYVDLKSQLGSLTGAMALDQKKIALCLEFISRFIEKIESKLN